MFNVNLPSNPSKGDFLKAKSDLHVQHLKKVASAPPRDQWAFGQCVAYSASKITRMFKQTLRSLNETCLSITGESCASAAELEDE
jgi:hypothetical protein